MQHRSLTRRTFLASTAALPATRAFASKDVPLVSLQRVPNGGLQPRVAVDSADTIHMVSYAGNSLAGDLFHAESRDGGRTFSEPVRVNRHPGSAVARGTVRGAQLAPGRNNRLHLAWNGSKDAGPKGPNGETPMLYTRSGQRGGFEPERNAIGLAYGLDGGGALAAAPDGGVYVFWHAPDPGTEGEEHRRVRMVRSEDDGKTFSPERVISNQPTGCCECCGMSAFADGRGNVFALYRSATGAVHRDMYLLASRDGGRTFAPRQIDRWEVGACVMSTAAFAALPEGVLAAWETKGQVYASRLDQGFSPIAAPGEPNGRKHPRLAANSTHTLLVWTERTGYSKGGSLAWQLYENRGGSIVPVAGERGEQAGLPAFSFATPYARPGGGFQIVY